MSLHINYTGNFFLSLVVIIFFSCKKVSSQERFEDKTIEKIEKKQEDFNWRAINIFSLAPDSNYDCTIDKYKNLLFNLKGDSVYINNKYSDDVYTVELSPKSYFERDYLFNTYKKRLKEELNINFPDIIKTIRNKKVYDKESLLDHYFQDAFFIGEYMFVEDNGCVIYFKKDSVGISKTEINNNSEGNFKNNVILQDTFKNVKSTALTENKTSKIKTNFLEKLQEKSFVVSCGGGCAMTYTAYDIQKKERGYKVKFSVDMYVDEVLSENFRETYLFLYDKSNNINKIFLDGTKSDALETLPSDARSSYVEFSRNLITLPTN